MLKRVSRIAWLVLALGACSKPAPPEKQAIVLPPDVSAPAAAAPVPAGSTASTCDLAPAHEVSNALGIAGLIEPTVQQQGKVTLCQYSDGTNPQRVLIRFESGRSPRELDRTKQMFEQSGQPTTLVPGIGDAALSMSAEAAGQVHSMVLAFKGSRTIQVGAPAPADKLAVLVRQIVAKL